MILMEMTAAIDAAGTLKTFYLGTDAYTTNGAETPPYTNFLNVLQDPGSLSVSAYSDSSTTGGATQLDSGEIVIANANGQFDDWVQYGFDGRPVVIRYSPDGAGAYPAQWTLLFQGTVESIEANWRQLVVKLRDKQFMLDLPLLPAKYAGTNSGPTGLEGTSTDLKDKAKPRVYGSVFQITPPCVNTSTLTYQVSDLAVANIPQVYDRGVRLTQGANYTNNAGMQGAVPGAGTYVTCFAEGLFRLASSPAGQVTADVTNGAASANRTVAQLLKTVGLAAGLSAGEISSTDVTALDALNNAEVGIYIDGEATTFLEVMSNLAVSIGAWFGFDPQGVLRMGVLSVPTGTPVLDLHTYEFSDKIERRAARDNGIPVWQVKVAHSKVWSPQTDLASSVTAADRAYFAQDFRFAEASDTSVKLKYKLAKKLEVETLLISAAAAAAEASRQLGLYQVNRSLFTVTIPVDLVAGQFPRFMDVVRLTVDRFDLSSGKMFRLIGISYELATSQISLTLWG